MGLYPLHEEVFGIAHAVAKLSVKRTPTFPSFTLKPVAGISSQLSSFSLGELANEDSFLLNPRERFGHV